MGGSWSGSLVDPSEWERNESSWVDLENGELVTVLRSNYFNSVGLSRSTDRGKTWSRVVPALFRTRQNVLLLAVRSWDIFISLDHGRSWSCPTHIGGYSGSGLAANLLEMADGRILVVNSTHGNAPNGRVMGQFIGVDRKGWVSPALPGPLP